MKKILIMSAVTAGMLTTVSADSIFGDMLTKMKDSVASMSQGAKESIEAVKSTEKTEETVEKAEDNKSEEVTEKTDDNESASFISKVKDIFK